MTSTVKIILLISMLCGYSFSVYAADETNYQANAIAGDDLNNAESALLAVLDKNPDDPFALLNLAFVYQKAGQQDKAREIYYRILTLKNNPYAELASGDTERVKSIAQRGIDRVELE